MYRSLSNVVRNLPRVPDQKPEAKLIAVPPHVCLIITLFGSTSIAESSTRRSEHTSVAE